MGPSVFRPKRQRLRRQPGQPGAVLAAAGVERRHGDRDRHHRPPEPRHAGGRLRALAQPRVGKRSRDARRGDRCRLPRHRAAAARLRAGPRSAGGAWWRARTLPARIGKRRRGARTQARWAATIRRMGHAQSRRRGRTRYRPAAPRRRRARDPGLSRPSTCPTTTIAIRGTRHARPGGDDANRDSSNSRATRMDSCCCGKRAHRPRHHAGNATARWTNHRHGRARGGGVAATSARTTLIVVTATTPTR